MTANTVVLERQRTASQQRNSLIKPSIHFAFSS